MATKRTHSAAAKRASARKKPLVRDHAVDAASTRLALMRAAERLMAERDVHSVSLREVSASAGALNNSAVLYHFGSRDALIDAILERHSQPIHARWASQLDFIDRRGGLGLRPLVELLVVELVGKLDDDDGGWEYLAICGQLLLSVSKPLVERSVGNTATVQRLITSMAPHCSVPAAFLPGRFERILHLVYAGIIAYRRFERAGLAPLTREVFTSELIDAVLAVVTAPLSPETAALVSP